MRERIAEVTQASRASGPRGGQSVNLGNIGRIHRPEALFADPPVSAAGETGRSHGLMHGFGEREADL